ncbi:MAG: sugar transferase [Mariniblastus sp.]|nr:sugar transferase [Mariniblastus sp.]
MIIPTQQKPESWFRRMTDAAPSQWRGPGQLLSDEQFKHELTKEVYRSNRRTTNLEFGLIQIIFPTNVQNQLSQQSQLLADLSKQLRMTDSIGFYENNLGFLLPETGKQDSLALANVLAKTAHESGFSVDTEVSVYPWDDELIALSEHLKTLRETAELDPQIDPSEFRDSASTNKTIRVDKPGTAHPPSPRSFNTHQNSRVSRSLHAFVKTVPTPRSKRIVDIVGSLGGLVLLAPLFLLIAITIKITSKGPLLFVQQREGKNGKPFGILKFRTMVIGAAEKQDELRLQSEQDGPAFKLKNDPRVTPIGKYLRKSCLDELPQLFNVLVGHMSLVGPRPLPVQESHACQAWQRLRLTVLPGLTCTWQIHGGRDLQFSQWMRMDLEYIRKRSFLFDLKLIIKTAFIAVLHRASV